MGMTNLQVSLDALRAEVALLGEHDGPVRARLERLIGDLERQLANPDDAVHRDSMIETLERLAERFEVEHPRVTGVFNRLMNALSNLGI